ncbi:MAG: hypothetical protein AAF353_06215 [Pseudomonadota bacterium]
MLDIIENDTCVEVRFRQFLLAAVLLCVPPLMAFHQGPAFFAGTLSSGESLGLFLGLVLPTLTAFYFIEFGRFTFSLTENRFSWQWRNLFKSDSGSVSLDRVIKIRHEGLEASDLAWWQNAYRLVAVLDDGQVIPLTHSYSGQHGKKIDQIVDQLRDYLGHIAPMD